MRDRVDEGFAGQGCGVEGLGSTSYKVSPALHVTGALLDVQLHVLGGARHFHHDEIVPIVRTLNPLLLPLPPKSRDTNPIVAVHGAAAEGKPLCWQLPHTCSPHRQIGTFGGRLSKLVTLLVVALGLQLHLVHLI